MKIDKYYGTNTFIYPNQNFIDKYGDTIHKQYKIVGKAKSFAEVNRKAEEIGLRNNIFTKGYTSETRNKVEIEMCNKYDFIICTTGVDGNVYADIKEAINS